MYRQCNSLSIILFNNARHCYRHCHCQTIVCVHLKHFVVQLFILPFEIMKRWNSFRQLMTHGEQKYDPQLWSNSSSLLHKYQVSQYCCIHRPLVLKWGHCFLAFEMFLYPVDSLFLITISIMY